MNEMKTIKQVIDDCGGIENLMQSVIEHRSHVEQIIARKPGPVRAGSFWVMDAEGYIHPRDSRRAHYNIQPTFFSTWERAQDFARHLSTKNWVSDQSLMDFLDLAATVHNKKTGGVFGKGGKVRGRRNRVFAKTN